ncbi:MAG TPA: DUF4838 domain-containing protein [Chthoniobacteraceae bacterium]|nr:DUF4838 domain-containing protein [Chthoniobacteraceae bacterium]
MNHPPSLLRSALALCFCLAMTSPLFAQAADVAVWGWRAKAWQELLKEQWSLESDVLQGEGERVPVERFKDYRLVVIGQGKPGALTPEEHRQVHDYLENGGVLLINTISISGLGRAEGDAARSLAGGESWIGGLTYSYGTLPATVLEPENPALAHLKADSYGWFDAQPGIAELTSARALIGVDRDARVLVHRVGKGGLIFISPEVIGTIGSKELPEAEVAAFTEMLGVFVEAAAKGKPALEAVLGEPVRGALIEHGGERRELVIVTTEEDRKAAGELAALVGESQGKQVKVLTGAGDGSRFEIHVGATPYVKGLSLDFKTLHPFGYYLKLADADHLVLAGSSRDGTGYAVYDFLKRYNGYRYFANGSYGTVLPKRDAIVLPEKLDDREEPSLASYTNAGSYKGNGAFARSWRTTLYATHILSSIVPPAKYGKTHPDYFPMYDGERFIPGEKLHGTWQPCVSHPDLPGLTIQWAKGYLEKHPDALGFPLGVNDGGGDCRCPDCLEAKKKYGNQYIPYYNAVARLAKEKFPGKYVAFIAYGGAATPPTGIQLEDNLLVEVVSGLADHHQPMKEWKAAGAKHFGLYDYLYGAGYVVPRHYPRVIGDAWKEAMRKDGLISTWVETFTRSWYFDGPRLYVMNELAWNIDADVDALLDDYFTSFYGPAAAPMRSFFDRLEAIYARKTDPLNPMGDRKRPAQLEEFTAEDVAYLGDRLEAARREAGEGIHRQRLDAFEALWKVSDLFIEVNLLVRKVDALPGSDRSWPGLVADAYAKMKAIADYEIPKALQKEIFASGDLDAYKGIETLRMRPALELAADRLFQRIDADLTAGGETAALLPYWKETLAGASGEELQLLVKSHIAEHEAHQPPVNLFSQASVAASGDLVESDWEKADPRLPGWYTWTFPRSRTQFAVTSDTPDGRYAMGIRQNDIAGSFLRYWKVRGNERYRATLYVKQGVGDTPVRLSIRWKNASGFLPETGNGTHAPISVPFPEPTGEWEKVSVVFTVPKEATTGVFLLGGPRQPADRAIWFHDVSLYRIYPNDHETLSTSNP